jgi:predicted RNA binding protein YcfA (HicA-like mRNA interferase family)
LDNQNIKGSHYYSVHADHPGLKVQVSLHHGDVPKGTLNNIKKLTGVDL